MEVNIWLVLSFFAAIITVAAFMYAILKKEKEAHEEEEDVERRSRHIVEKAHDQARSLMYTTSLASGELLKDVHATSEHIDENLDRVLQTIAQKHIEYLNKETDTFTKTYEDRLNKIQQQFDLAAQQLVQNSEAKMNLALEQFMQPIARQMADSQTFINTRTQELLTQTEKDIADYKAKRITNIESHVDELINKTYRDVLKRSIPESVHEELIMQSLEKAKEDKLFDI